MNSDMSSGGLARPARSANPTVSAEQIRKEADSVRRRIARAHELWNESLSPYGTAVERYLCSRGLGAIAIPLNIRFHPRVWNQEANTTLPAMIAAITDVRSQFVGIHRTFLRADGGGIVRGTSAKKILGVWGHVMIVTPLNGRLLIVASIENALLISKARPDLGVYSAMSLNNMGAPVPRSVRELILCGEGDEKDASTSDALLEAAMRKHRVAHENCLVRSIRLRAGMNFNDMLPLERM